MQTMTMWRRSLDSLIWTWRMALAWDSVVWNGGSALTGLVWILLRMWRICCSLPVATLTVCGRDVSSSFTSCFTWLPIPCTGVSIHKEMWTPNLESREAMVVGWTVYTSASVANRWGCDKLATTYLQVPCLFSWIFSNRSCRIQVSPEPGNVSAATFNVSEASTGKLRQLYF